MRVPLQKPLNIIFFYTFREGGMNFFRGGLAIFFFNYKFLAKCKVLNQKFRGGLILQSLILKVFNEVEKGQKTV